MVWNFQSCRPVFTSNAATNPRMPMSPPATPIVTLSFTTIGGIVIEYCCAASATTVSHNSCPLFASIASRCASTVPMNSVLPRIARPRFTRPQQVRAGDGWCEYVQNRRPVAASSATTSFGACTVYITPFTTSGVASNFSSERACHTHFSCSFDAFFALICASGLWRWFE